MRLKHVILLAAKYAGLFFVGRMLTAKKVRILAYHGIWLGGDHFGNFLYMSAEKFKTRMALLARWHYPVVSLSDLYPDKMSAGLPACATVITIDDGWYGSYSKMLPVLEEHHYPATIYLTTYYCLNQRPVIDVALQYLFQIVDVTRCPSISLPRYDLGPLPVATREQRSDALAKALAVCNLLDSDCQRQEFLRQLCTLAYIDYRALVEERWFHLMTPAEVEDATTRGITFELHTHHHRITHVGKDCLASEIVANRLHIENLTGRIPAHFCYPSGRFTPELWPGLKDCKIRSATTTDIGLADANTPKYALPRILDGEQISELEFEAEMSGFLELKRELARGLRKLLPPRVCENRGP